MVLILAKGLRAELLLILKNNKKSSVSSVSCLIVLTTYILKLSTYCIGSVFGKYGFSAQQKPNYYVLGQIALLLRG